MIFITKKLQAPEIIHSKNVKTTELYINEKFGFNKKEFQKVYLKTKYLGNLFLRLLIEFFHLKIHSNRNSKISNC